MKKTYYEKNLSGRLSVKDAQTMLCDSLATWWIYIKKEWTGHMIREKEVREIKI